MSFLCIKRTTQSLMTEIQDLQALKNNGKQMLAANDVVDV